MATLESSLIYTGVNFPLFVEIMLRTRSELAAKAGAHSASDKLVEVRRESCSL